MLLSLLSVSLVLLAGLDHKAFAADCYGGSGIDPNVASAWQLRDQVCGHNACAASDTAGGNNHFCRISLPFGNGQAVEIQRSDPSGVFKNCYGATENIINQCLDNPSGGGITDKNPNGSWRLGDEWYWVTMNYTLGAAEQINFGNAENGIPNDGCVNIPHPLCSGQWPTYLRESIEPFQNSITDAGIFTSRYMFGPNKFCQGYAPGSGDSCVDIPDGCFIAVPLSNTAPKVECTLPDIDSS